MRGDRRRFVRVGLTGGIAAGKSTVAARMAADGADVIDYDFLAHVLQEPCSPVIAPIAEAFGDDVVDARGGIDRKALADRVFGAYASEGALETLNGIMHPNVYELARNRERSILARGGRHVLVHDIPLLGEVMDTIPFVFDTVVCIVAPEGERIRRLVATRGMTPDQARTRVEGQGSDASRLRYADVVIDATQPIEQMFDYVDNLVGTWFDEE
ncbi:dephospho-CoA kinase [Bifidobacterium italicum]|uniref:Dephospho-CoA kinase n=1 Tax=Bifidobacterium italicum TaxID=1960968 RepID=A0A2A2EI68_9BIFI|nr:dephospho-CoA kinase [Bifidobacterium italicum]PAU68753.1 dephospho-CoA kinase [Bifidobacterium italicum]